MAGESIVSEMSASASATSSSVGNPQMHSPRCQRAANDGRSGRKMRHIVVFGMSSGASLPPSTGSFHSINVEIMDRAYEFIASSISDLAR